jgi:hypothetical protein
MESSRRLVIAAAIGVALIALAAVSDFVVGSFWSGHAMLTSLIASLVVLIVTVAVLNEWLARRDRKRWSVLAQYVLFQLVQAARATWTSLVELMEQREIESVASEDMRALADRALDTRAISAATRLVLADEERRRKLHKVVTALAEHSKGVVVSWASVMVGAGPFTDIFDRYVELQARLDWLGDLIAPGEQPTRRDALLARSSVASEHADRLGSDDWLHDQIVATIQTAVRLDFESRELGFTLVPMEWWRDRTQIELGQLTASPDWHLITSSAVELPDQA